MDIKAMTPGEKKATECIDAGNKCSCIKGDEPCERHQIYAIELALSEAERRGFERAKRMAKNIVKSLPAKVPVVPIVSDVFNMISFEMAEEIENLKYEEA